MLEPLKWKQQHCSSCPMSIFQWLGQTLQTITLMAHSYITKKQVGHEFYFYSIKYTSHMLNQAPVYLGHCLMSPFELVISIKHMTLHSLNSSWLTALMLLLIWIMQNHKYNFTQTTSLLWVEMTNLLIVFYNPVTKKNYQPSIFKVDGDLLPIANFPSNVCFDGGCLLLCNQTDSVMQVIPQCLS